MGKTNETALAGKQVRPPNADEQSQLADWLCEQGQDLETAEAFVETASVAVHDDYCTDCPGYSGKVMSVVWSGSHTFFDVFTWEAGKLIREGRDFDERECYRCGAKHGTLCANCWRQWSIRTCG